MSLPEGHPLREVVSVAVRSVVSGHRPDAEALTLGDAIAALAELRDGVELQLRELIHHARDEGATWGAIAGLLHVTPQAAHKRYGPKAPPPRAPVLGITTASASGRRRANG